MKARIAAWAVSSALLVGNTIAIEPASAAPVVVIGTGGVLSIDRQATFDNLNQGASLLNYIEGGLLVSVNDTNCCFPGAYYGSGGNNSYVTIATTDGADFSAIAVGIGTGFTSGPHNLVWQTLKDGVVTGSGLLSLPLFGLSSLFATVSWTDLALIDTLLLGAAPTSTGYSSLGQFQAIALDNVRIDLSTVPIPGALPLFASALGLAGLWRWRKRKMAALPPVAA